MNSNSIPQDVEVPVAGPHNTENQESTSSTEEFQKYIYELFKKNGILNDLRTYLRKQIVNVLNTAQTGNAPIGKKNFTQRLELTFQAVNILIAEYLLRLDFGYALSVFVSEIPLANMVFDYAKALMASNTAGVSSIRFSDDDVWSILNYLGIQCDSEHVSHTLAMYRNNEQLSLLLCILKCVPMYQKETVAPIGATTHKGVLLSGSSETLPNKDKMLPQGPSPEGCRHLVHHQTCQAHLMKISDKFVRKKEHMNKSLDQNFKSLDNEHAMKNIGAMERSFIEEMFQQLKSVYESEIEMMRQDEDRKIRQSIASHVLQLQKLRDELEESYKAREAQLEKNVCEKKRFLWGLAKTLRDKNQLLERAMRDLQDETARLTDKENYLKARLAEAENTILKRADEMRIQISSELTTLEDLLKTMKIERDNINKERAELEMNKNVENAGSKVIKVHSTETAEMQSHYNLIKTEMDSLKKYIHASKINCKSVSDKGVVTELRNVNLNISLNNNQHVDIHKSDDYNRLKNQLVNDFKKKNVNFTPSKVDELYHVSNRSSGSSEAGDSPQTSRTRQSQVPGSDSVHRLREENNMLKECARQQQSHSSALSLPRPCTCSPARLDLPTMSTPTPCQPQYFLHGVNTCSSANTVSMSWFKGAGEELSVFSDTQPTIVVPGDSIPFVGVVRNRERHIGSRRHLLSQMRSLRSYQFPATRVRKRPQSPGPDRPSSSSRQTVVTLEQDNNRPVNSQRLCVREKGERHVKSMTLDVRRNREKSPKSVLREAKERLRNIKDLTVSVEDKSSNMMLREAKLRLRKLEIEAEAVEKSFLDFRRRQTESQAERTNNLLIEDNVISTNIDSKKMDADVIQTGKKIEHAYEMDIPLTDYQKSLRNDFTKYLCEYKTDLDREINFKQQTVEYIKPFPEPYSNEIKQNKEMKRSDYLETPLAEFRKLYRSKQDNAVKRTHSPNREQMSSECGSSRQISPQNVQIIHKNPNEVFDNAIEVVETNAVDDKTANDEQNLLRVEVENGEEIHESKDIREVSDQNNLPYNMSRQMVIVVSPTVSTPKAVEGNDVDAELRPSEKPKRSVSPERAANLTRNDVLEAIFNVDPNYKVRADKTAPTSVSDERERRAETDDRLTTDDASRLSSPMSVLKPSDDEDFW